MVRLDRDEHARATAAGIHGTSGGNFPEKARARVVEVGHWQVARGKLVCELSSRYLWTSHRRGGCFLHRKRTKSPPHAGHRNVSDFPLLKAILNPWTDAGTKG